MGSLRGEVAMLRAELETYRGAGLADALPDGTTAADEAVLDMESVVDAAQTVAEAAAAVAEASADAAIAAVEEAQAADANEAENGAEDELLEATPEADMEVERASFWERPLFGGRK